MTIRNDAGERFARLKDYLSGDPENWALRAEVFDASLEAGQLDFAEAESGRALSERPEDPVWRHRRTSWLLASRRYEEARGELEALLADGIADPAVVHDLAFALHRLGQVEDAAARVEPLLPITGDRAGPIWTLWLRCQHHLGRVSSAVDAFQARLQLERMSPEALGVASLIATDAGRLREASAWSRAALEQNENQMEAIVARGTLALVATDPAQAAAWFDRALNVNPRDGRTWSGVALTRMLGKDLPGAEQAFSMAVETMPSHQGTWIARGWCQLLLQRHADARQTFERAVALDGSFAEAHGCLAVALARLGEREAAEREIELARRLEPGGLGARYAEAVLAGKGEDPDTVRILSALALKGA